MVNSDFNASYTGLRKDIYGLVPISHKHILDIGCSTGVIGEQIALRNKAEVIGVEIDENMAKIAATRLHRVITGDIEQLSLSEQFSPGYFNTIIFADILEHLKDPWKVLSDTSSLIKEEGLIIVSLPNVRHFTTLFSLIIQRRWPYRQRGIHDRTHLRFFALNNIKTMLDNAGYVRLKIIRKYRIYEKPHPINHLAKLFALPLIRDFFTYQYIVVGRKRL